VNRPLSPEQAGLTAQPFKIVRTLQARTLFKRKMEAAAREVAELSQRVALANGWVPSVLSWWLVPCVRVEAQESGKCRGSTQDDCKLRMGFYNSPGFVPLIPWSHL
jgi:hypothetical protein